MDERKVCDLIGTTDRGGAALPGPKLGLTPIEVTPEQVANALFDEMGICGHCKGTGAYGGASWSGMAGTCPKSLEIIGWKLVDMKPDVEGCYLVWPLDHGVGVAVWMNGRWIKPDGFTQEVTHWMEFPEGPR